MNPKTVQRQAEKDAVEYAAAYMAYGEGAGNRRKLIEGTVDYKMEFMPGYREAFMKAHGHQDMAKHAQHAKKENRRKTVNTAVNRNTKAIVTGKYENLNTALLITGSIAYVLHKTGHDKTVINFTKKKAKEIRQRFRKTVRPEPAKAKPTNGDDNVHRITDV